MKTAELTDTLLCWCGADAALEEAVRAAGRPDLRAVKTASEFIEAFHEERPAYVILGAKPASETMRLLGVLAQARRAVPVFVALSEPNADQVRLFMRAGARDVLWVDELPGGLPEAGAGAQGADEALADAAPPEAREIICSNEAMQKVVDIAARIAPTDSTVLVQGESGTGKELIAGLIHTQSRRARKAFIKVNCGAIPEPLLESQLYGHEKGSFTGAIKQHKGLFEMADQGTIFLDEIGEMSLEMQVKLLRFLESKELRRVGGHEVIKVDVRVITATNRDLKREVARNRFRSDLFYRINVITLHLPALRERPEEIAILSEYFMGKLSAAHGVAPKAFSVEALAAMQGLPWPGNVRELENAVERLLLLAPAGTIEPVHLAEFLDLSQSSPASPAAAACGNGAAVPVEQAASWKLEDMERVHIERVLGALKWNKMRASRALGINVKTLYNKIRGYGLTPPSDAEPDPVPAEEASAGEPEETC
ncbi:MAG TPA: hypothetical protein DCM87_01840 [Planctomycetes bacterium]|nr:hypothetical protein [Planctomycetota bacterium]